MSTKIYDAYRTNANLSTLLKQFCLLRKECEKKAHELILQKIKIFKPENGSRAVYSEIINLIGNDAKKKYASHWYSDFDFEVSVSVFEYKHLRYLIFFGNRKMIEFAIQTLNKSLFLEGYPYQGSADKPGNVTEKTWNKRGKTWDAILQGKLVETGFTFELCQFIKIRSWDYSIEELGLNEINKGIE